MSKELYYLPCERTSGRWTEYVSGPSGMFAYCFTEARPDYNLIVIQPDDKLHEIKSGVVHDTWSRTEYGFEQIKELLTLIDCGKITSDSVIYFEDFWTPGMEMLPYACHLKGISPKVYAFCHAQSVDPNDFTYPMRHWMRGFEQGWAKWLTGIFVASKELKSMLVGGYVCPMDKIHVVGTVYNRKYLLQSYYSGFPPHAYNLRKPVVLFPHRLDKEKRVDVFYALAKYYNYNFFDLGTAKPNATFMVVSGKRVVGTKHKNIVYAEEQSKKQYLELLSSSQIVFSAAKQDFVGYCLLDALAYGCFPLYPKYLSYPDALGGDEDCLYDEVSNSVTENELANISFKIAKIIEEQKLRSAFIVGDKEPTLYSRYGKKYEESVLRMTDIMFKSKSLEQWIADGRAIS